MGFRYAGIDLGSRSVKLVLADTDFGYSKKGLGGALTRIYDTACFYRDFGAHRSRLDPTDATAFKVNLSKLIPESKLDAIVCTGYGQQTIEITEHGSRPLFKTVSEITAHVAGAAFLSKLCNFTLLDLGGQDSKVAKVRNHRITDFETNDRCAASTGRYLENMTAVLGTNLETLQRHALDPVHLSSTCAVFGETELITKIAQGFPLSELCAGVNHAVFQRIKPVLRKLISEKLVFTGGVAQNSALQQIISTELRVNVLTFEEAQYAGALGCAMLARKLSKHSELN